MRSGARVLGGWLAVLALCAVTVRGAEWFVATNGSDAAAGTSWATAKQTPQAAVNAAGSGDTVWVSNGVYATGGRWAAYFNTRVVIDRSVTVQSINGPEVTIISGDGISTRGAYVADGAVLSGFTINNGRAYEFPQHADSCGGNGGGAYCENNGVLTNCVISGNFTCDGGGGVWGGHLFNCTLSYNRSCHFGGGAYDSTLNACLVVSNTADQDGGGAYGGTLNNCLVKGNNSLMGGGAMDAVLNNSTLTGNIDDGTGCVRGCTLNNCIVYGNSPGNHSSSTFNYSCTTPDPGGTGNITNNPQFVDAASGDYRLVAGSPCIDAGNNSYVQGTTDLDGNPRIIGSNVDMGAYEAYQGLMITPASTNLPYGQTSGCILWVLTSAAWTASTNESWLTISSGESGTANGMVVFDVAANEVTASRTGAIVVAGGELTRTCTVVQAAFVPGLAIAPSSTNLAREAASGLALGVTANVSWTAVTNGPWLSITSGGSGTNNGTVIFDLAANETYFNRTGMIVVAGGGLIRTCTVVQAGIVAVLGLTPPGTNLSYGATSDVAIGVTADVSWTAETNVAWLAIISGETGISNGVVVFSAAANAGAFERIGGIVLAGGGLVRTCTVVQAYEGQLAFGYDIWATDITNGLTGPTECATGDGAPNLLKYATGSSATQADDYPFLVGNWSNQIWKCDFHRNTNAWDVTIYIQRSSGITNGAPWNDIATNAYGSWNGATNVSESGTGNPVSCLYQDYAPLASNGFLRLRVTRP